MEKERVIRARTPVRIDFSGGWTDVALFTQESKGFVEIGRASCRERV